MPWAAGSMREPNEIRLLENQYNGYIPKEVTELDHAASHPRLQCVGKGHAMVSVLTQLQTLVP